MDMTRATSWIKESVHDQQARTTAILVVAIVVTAALFGASFKGFLSPFNISNIAVQTAVISLVAFGMTGVIIVRGIDLSVGSSLALSSVVGAQVLAATGGNSALTVVTVFAVALLVAAFNGFLVAVLRVNAFMATLGMLALARGAAISISGGAALPVADEVLLFLGTKSLLGIPYSVVVTVIALILFTLLLRRTMLGRWFFAVGGNHTAALASGIPTRRVEMSAFVLVGVVVGLGALLTIGRAGSVQPMAGLGLEFSAITAAVIGGASLAGGRGSIIATFLGSVFVGLLSSGLSFAGVDQSLIYLFTGLLTVLAVIVAQREVLQQIRDNSSFFLNTLRAGLSRKQRAAFVADSGASHSLTVVNLKKSFSGVEVLKGLDFTIKSGEVVALMGENGAGKSTLVKVLAGNHQPTSGSVLMGENPVVFAGPEDARKAGVAVIHQHFSLVSDLTVAQNLYLGQELRWGKFGPLRTRAMTKAADQLLFELELPFSAKQNVSSLSVGHRQMIEIVRAVREDAWLVVMDEPTSALSSRERDHLYELIERLKQRDTAILYISHKMDEIYHLCSRAIVLRDGVLVGSPELSSVQSSELVSMMVGREFGETIEATEVVVGNAVVVANNVSDGARLRNASITLRAGEVVGLVGLMGAGRTELIRSIAGLSRVKAGSLSVFGEPIGGRSLFTLSKQGLAFVPEDRHEEGVFPEMTVAENLSLLWMRVNSPGGWLSAAKERRIVAQLMGTLGVRPNDPNKRIKHLSGGNQQKAVLGKWLALEPTAILLDDPTRGVDVGAKAEIHALIAEFRAKGAAVLVTSSEVPEVLAVSDRIVIMRSGETVAEYARGVSEEEVMKAAFGDEGDAVRNEEETARAATAEARS